MIDFVWRPARKSDSRDLWLWRNDRRTRKASYSTARVPWAGHQEWFKTKLADPNCEIWIAQSASGNSLAQIRLDLIAAGVVEVSIVVNARDQGRGLGVALLADLPPTLGGRRWRRAIAWVKADNVDSSVAFLRAGFRFVRFARRKGAASYLFELRRGRVDRPL